MQKTKTDYTEDWRLYEEGIDYKTRIGLFDTVDKNNRFYDGDQWHGVISNGLPTPVFNIIRRVLQYKISSIMQNALKIKYSVEYGTPEQQAEIEKISQYTETLWEKLKMDTSNEIMLKDAAIQSDGCTYFYWDDSIDTGEYYGEETIKGNIAKEEIDNVCVFPGDCNNPVINTCHGPVQPYMLVVFRKTVASIKEEAKRNGLDEGEISRITPDEENFYTAGDRGKLELDEGSLSDYGKANVILKLWKDEKTGTIWARKSTKFTIVKKDWDTGCKLYPIAMMNWETKKNSFHGTADVTGLIPNQMYINKSAAMIMLATMYVSYPKLMYDKTRIAQPSTQIGTAIGVNGEISGAAEYLNPGQISSDVFNWFETVIQYTKEMMGANEAALGEVDPKNTSAIIAVQQASAIPLESVRRRFYQYVEDIALIWMDMFISKYSVPRTVQVMEKGQPMTMQINPQILKDAKYSVKIDVGPSSRWSEIATVQTLDKLFEMGKISDIEYFERVPDGFIKDKQGLIDTRKEMMQAQQIAAENPLNVDDIMAELTPEEQQAIAENPELLDQILQDSGMM